MTKVKQIFISLAVTWFYASMFLLTGIVSPSPSPASYLTTQPKDGPANSVELDSDSTNVPDSIPAIWLIRRMQS
jgi:hypothetical protein